LNFGNKKEKLTRQPIRTNVSNANTKLTAKPNKLIHNTTTKLHELLGSFVAFYVFGFSKSFVSFLSRLYGRTGARGCFAFGARVQVFF